MFLRQDRALPSLCTAVAKLFCGVAYSHALQENNILLARQADSMRPHRLYLGRIIGLPKHDRLTSSLSGCLVSRERSCTRSWMRSCLLWALFSFPRPHDWWKQKNVVGQEASHLDTFEKSPTWHHARVPVFAVGHDRGTGLFGSLSLRRQPLPLQTESDESV